ncbi:hypothetical protein HPP92_025369 [Vanilla planifolia]|uniref:Methyltransferase n=1 Tax=Vanilla planifolia TaxID=51239 RepID=A0A835PKH4_VANPL|nr:hypothetical protein HPP92_025369 [Vanilla planifolia]
MGSKMNSNGFRFRKVIMIVIVVGLCCFFYVLGAWQRSGVGRGDSIALQITKETECGIMPNLNFETHHSKDHYASKAKAFEPCDVQYTDYTPCQDQKRSMTFPRENMAYRERHCPSKEEKLRCLIPAPKGYMVPFPWPKSRDVVPYANVPYKSLTIEKADQNWVQLEGNMFKFPGGGTMFPQGADAYIDVLASVIPIADGMVRTALDIGCGVASWGAYLFKRNVLTISFAPRDSHEAQVQFALERGVPAFIGVLGTMRLPFPSAAFDMVHCSLCLIQWTSNAGMYMMEVDRILRPGGYWILSGFPINWKAHLKTWERSESEIQKEQRRIEELAYLLCWKKMYEKGDIAIWRKTIDGNSCQRKNDSSVSMCKYDEADNAWNKKMQVCITPFPSVKSPDEVVGKLKRFPDRLFTVPPMVASGSYLGVTQESYEEDKRLWDKHVKAYTKMNKLISSGRYRNIMDMNAGYGSFAAALEPSNSWVMNVVPTISMSNTLGIIYKRGLIGIYHDWCEAFSTYPRSYDLIHANGVFSLYQNKCDMEDILLEMDRILRPEGTIIFRDTVEFMVKVKVMATGMRWKMRMMDHEDGPLVPEKILIAVKTY